MLTILFQYVPVPIVFAVYFGLEIIGYLGIFRKAGLPQGYALIPYSADWCLSTKLFKYQRSFWRPFITMAVLVLAAMYLNPFYGSACVTARILLLCAYLTYGFFRIRLYHRLSKCFGMGFLFWWFMVLLPIFGLLILGYDKSEFRGFPQFKTASHMPKIIRGFFRVSFIFASCVEVVLFLGIVGFITIRERAPRPLVNYLLENTYTQTKDVVGADSIVTREAALGNATSAMDAHPAAREKFFPSHADDKNVVVFAYIIGSDLEERGGLASANIRQMVDATRQGSALTFVLECGGAPRWFTNGIKDGSYGRYAIHDGKIERLLDLPNTTCMSEEGELADFLTWGKENYPSDRYQLVLWDHGGGLGTGYGCDQVNVRDAEIPTLSVSELVQAIQQADLKFDVVGFDACLMQDIEVANKLEPYADYLLASEETEGGFGWFYTSGFGKLAQDPTISSQDFGREMIACYDPYNTIINDGEKDTIATLSFVDLSRAKAAYNELEGLFDQANEAIKRDSTSYANLSLSGTKSYVFSNNEQVDLVDFLTRLKGLDYDNKICSSERYDELANLTKSCVLYRNANSAEGVNGIALTFPCASISGYTYDFNQFNALSLEHQRSLYNDFFSIMAAQNAKAYDEAVEQGDLLGALRNVMDYTSEPWYVEGFENYETQEALVDIPLREVADGYEIELPEKAWPLIATCDVIAYQHCDGDLLRYLGRNEIGGVDESGHPLVAMDGSWVNVGGKLVCYEAGSSRETDDGVVFTGTVKAMLNGDTKVSLHVEWDPVSGESDAPVQGHITGYDLIFDDNPLMQLLGEHLTTALNGKAMAELSPGDRLDFLFDYYNAEGNLAKTEVYGGTYTVVSQERIDVTDAKLAPGDIEFGGVLTDVYQRVMTTEKIEAHID